jgi:hypothetical protein
MQLPLTFQLVPKELSTTFQLILVRIDIINQCGNIALVLLADKFRDLRSHSIYKVSEGVYLQRQ